MISRRGLAGCIGTIVTADTTRGYALMIKHTGGKTGGDMAGGTVFRGRDMVQRLASGGHAVVARRAIINDASMIEHCV